MKRFVVGTSRTTPEQDAKFLQLVRARWPHVGWWHQVTETWLFVDLLGTATAAALRDVAMEAFPTINLMVIEIKGEATWAGFGPQNTMFPWMNETWDRVR